MRKLLFLFISLILVISSCSTSIAVPYMQPSAIDMGGYRNLALASVVPYKGYSAPSVVVGTDIRAAGLRVLSGYTNSTAISTASYATDRLYSTLSSSGFFNILPPDSTDAVITAGYLGGDISESFRKLGYDAVLIPRITGMSVNESVYSVPHDEWWEDRDGDRHHRVEFEYYYRQIVSLDYSITVIDTESGRIVAQRTFSDTDKREDILDRRWMRLEDPSYLFRRIIRSFSDDIENLLVPSYQEYSVSLMSNKPKLEEAESAYDAAKDGNLELAGNLFLSIWEKSNHLPSGYNAALLAAASGDYTKAIDILSSVMEKYNDSDVRSLYRNLLTIRTRNEQAMGQITGESSALELGAPNGNAIYSLVMGR